MAINSKQKGSKNERDVAKLLEAWTGVEFARVPMSGGLGWKNRVQVTGDVIPTDPKDMVSFPFSVEAKFHKEIDFEAPLLGQNVNWLDWWEQSEGDAEKAGKIAIVFMRRNLMPKGEHYCILDVDIFEELRDIRPKVFRNPRGYYLYNDETVIFPSRDLLRTPYTSVEECLKDFRD